MASQTAMVGQTFNPNLANTFTDQETPDQLSLVAAGLTLAGSTISSTASTSGVSTVTITVVPASAQPPTTATFSLNLYTDNPSSPCVSHRAGWRISSVMAGYL